MFFRDHTFLLTNSDGDTLLQATDILLHTEANGSQSLNVSAGQDINTPTLRQKIDTVGPGTHLFLIVYLKETNNYLGFRVFDIQYSGYKWLPLSLSTTSGSIALEKIVLNNVTLTSQDYSYATLPSQFQALFPV